MNETLEEMGRSLFKDWFVDFGPTRAKVEGRAPYLAPDLYALFPDALDENGLPEGWVSKPLDEIAIFLNGLALQKYPPENDALAILAFAVPSGSFESGRGPKSGPAARSVSS